MTNFVPALALCDAYKNSHRKLYPEGTEVVYSVLTPRQKNHWQGRGKKVVAFGFQYFVQKYLVEYFNDNFFSLSLEEAITRHLKVIKPMLGDESVDHILALHTLGYLPLAIQAVPEGTKVPFGVPMLSIKNTRPEFYWLTNYIETLLSAETWQAMTSATIASEFHEIARDFAFETCDDLEHLPFQIHDFSMRGMSSLESAMISGAAHLIFSAGTDTIPALSFLEKYYDADLENELVGTSIPATEHSVMCAHTPADTNRDERAAFLRIIKDIHPTGFVSIVSDSYDFWKVVTETLPSLKEEIMNRDGRVVIRPDSGNPVEILAGKVFRTFDEIRYPVIEDVLDSIKKTARAEMIKGNESIQFLKPQYKEKFTYQGLWFEVLFTLSDKEFPLLTSLNKIPHPPEAKGLIECLWDTFGGHNNDLGMRVLDPHIGAIYGDGITPDVARQTLDRLYAKGFASSNIVFGVGSYTYQMNSRDTLGFAVKATYAEINGEPVMLQKDPKTDSSKKSARGQVAVYRDANGTIDFVDGLVDGQVEGIPDGADLLMHPIFINGKSYNRTNLTEIRDLAKKVF